MSTKQELPRDDTGQLIKWAWPGGYPVFYFDSENGILCADCARKSDGDPDELEQYKPAAFDINYEDEGLFCDQCGARIESAYGDPDQ